MKYLKILLVTAVCLAGCQNVEETEKRPSACTEQSACEAVPADNDFEQITFDEAIDIFKNGDSAILYFGFPKCPWCQEAVPILKEEAAKAGKEVLYVQTRDDELNRLYTDEQRDEIEPYISEYMEKDDDGNPAIFVPLVINVKDGKAVAGHVGTVDGHDAHERSMTEDEKKQLTEIYSSLLNE